MLTFHEVGEFPVVRSEWCSSTRAVIPEVEQMIDRAWAEALARPGVNLFDGPMCRMESYRVDGGNVLHLRLSRTTYREFLGTNLTHPQLVDRYGRDVMANPVGVSPALVTADEYLLLGWRNESVAYYPNRLHPFAGAVEPVDGSAGSPAGASCPDVLQEVRRELREELGLAAADVTTVICTGIVEDKTLRQNEMIFYAQTTQTRTQLEAQLHDAEHDAAWSVPAEPLAVERALAGDDPFTPVARAALLLFGRLRFGEDWFNRNALPWTT